jgi:hypothetical protein
MFWNIWSGADALGRHELRDPLQERDADVLGHERDADLRQQAAGVGGVGVVHDERGVAPDDLHHGDRVGVDALGDRLGGVDHRLGDDDLAARTMSLTTSSYF